VKFWGLEQALLAADLNRDGIVNIDDLNLFAQEWLNTVPVDLVLIPSGEFQMGDHDGVGNNDELPVHEVHIHSFYMSKYETANQRIAISLTRRMSYWTAM